MSKHKNDILSLEEEMALVETGAFDEEKLNAKRNYNIIKTEIDTINKQIPYPNTTKYSTVSGDYSGIDDLRYEKRRNEPYWNRLEEVSKYYDDKHLYVGHISLNDGEEYYLLDNTFDSTNFSNESGKVFFVNVNDSLYREIVKGWRFPQKNENVYFSRNIELYNREVKNVEIVLDKSNGAFSNITDRYLRNTLIRNKNRDGIHSIIQTIQEKQDNIVTLRKDKSFVVQGCAGSGKTMVLLHRLKYLLFNEMINQDEYIFIVPSNNFKEFINDASEEFNIKSKNIVPVQKYYRDIVGDENDSDVIESDEFLFGASYLERVYSKKFIKEAYEELLNLISAQTSTLTDICENKLNEIIEKETITLDQRYEREKNNAVVEVKKLIGTLEEFVNVKLNEFEDVSLFIIELKKKYDESKELFNNIEILDEDIIIEADDIRILSNKELKKIKSDIEEEEKAVEKASFFTAKGHKKKLIKLKGIYDSKYDLIVEELIEEDKKRLAKNAINTSFVFEEFRLEDIKDIIIKSEEIHDNARKELDDIIALKESFDETIENKFFKQIEYLNEAIESSADIIMDAEILVKNLLPSVEFFNKHVQNARNLIDSFEDFFNDTDRETIAEECKLFAVRSTAKFGAYVQMLLFNTCKRKIKEEYEIIICKEYKHYWYLALYCKFLTRQMTNKNYSYIYIDEGQDLSLSEIELINKLNSTISMESNEYLITPILNIFGDVNQMIMNHGIKNWNSISFIEEQYELSENFRNPNQVVEFCNNRLPFNMEMIGIDLEQVDEYLNLKDAMLNCDTIKREAIFIVKDEYAKMDLELEIEEHELYDYEILTVKEAKGLEYKEVFVIDRRMTNNEKYIAYTRAVKKLNVINTLENRVDLKQLLFKEGDESEADNMA